MDKPAFKNLSEIPDDLLFYGLLDFLSIFSNLIQTETPEEERARYFETYEEISLFLILFTSAVFESRKTSQVSTPYRPERRTQVLTAVSEAHRRCYEALQSSVDRNSTRYDIFQAILSVDFDDLLEHRRPERD